MCDNTQKKSLRSAQDDASIDNAGNSFQQDGINQVLADPNLATSDLVFTQIPRGDVTGSDFYGGGDLEVDRRYARGYRSSAVVPSVCTAQDATHEPTQRVGGSD